METLQRELARALSEIKKLKSRVDMLTDRTPLASDHGVLELTTSVAGPAGRTGVLADVMEVTDENKLQLTGGTGGGLVWEITGGSSQNWTIQKVALNDAYYGDIYTGVEAESGHSTNLAIGDRPPVLFKQATATDTTLTPVIMNAVWVEPG